jgi:hypothetical protein
MYPLMYLLLNPLLAKVLVVDIEGIQLGINGYKKEKDTHPIAPVAGVVTVSLAVKVLHGCARPEETQACC